MDDIIARINKCVESAEMAGWEDVGFPDDLLIECREEIARLRITEEERAAIRRSAREWDDCHEQNAPAITETLRGLLERTK